MKTILFINENEGELWSSYLRFDFLLDEFKDKGAYDICPWNSAGRSVKEAIPRIADALGSETDWQAVIVTDLRPPYETMLEDEHFDNPFDFPENYSIAPGDDFTESARSIVRLTQMLGGLPEKVHIEWPDGSDSVPNLNDFGLSYGAHEGKYDIIDRYRLGLPRPKSIVCITPRDMDEAFHEARKHDLATKKSPSSELDFWERNGYPNTARFLVYDRIAPAKEPDYSETEADLLGLQEDVESPVKDGDPDMKGDYWFRFWMCVLTVMTSSPRSGTLKAFDVYKAETFIDDEALRKTLGAKRAEWVSAVAAIDDKLDFYSNRQKPSEYLMADEPDTDVNIPVSFDQVSRNKLFTDPEVVRFYKDDPNNDLYTWEGQKNRTMEEFRELLRAPKRALMLAAAKFRGQEPIPESVLDDCILNQYQVDKLADAVKDEERQLAWSAGIMLFNFKHHSDAFEKESDRVVGEIRTRATKKQSIAVLGISLALVLTGFLPYCLGMIGSIENIGGAGSALASILITIAVLFLVIVVWTFTMRGMRKRVRNAYSGFNDVMSGILNQFRSEASRLEKRISTYASLRKKWSVLERQNHLDAPTKDAKDIAYKKALLNTRIKDIKRLARNCDIEDLSFIQGTEYDWDTLKLLLKDESFFQLNSSDADTGLDESIAVVTESSFQNAPYAFIKSIELEPLRIR